MFFTGGAILLCIGAGLFLKCATWLNIKVSDISPNDHGSGEYIDRLKKQAQSELEAEKAASGKAGS